MPLGPGGSRHYRTAVMDLPGRTAIDGPVHVAPDDAILLADGSSSEVRPADQADLVVDNRIPESPRLTVRREQNTLR